MLTANLRLLPLLLQRFEIADVMMLRPHIHVVRDSHGQSNWTPFIETIARTMKPGADNQVSFSEIRIQDGMLFTRTPPAGHREARRYRPVAGLALDLALVCRDRTVRLARRTRRRLDQRRRLRRSAFGRPLGLEGAARQRAAKARLRRHASPTAPA